MFKHEILSVIALRTKAVVLGTELALAALALALGAAGDQLAFAPNCPSGCIVN